MPRAFRSGDPTRPPYAGYLAGPRQSRRTRKTEPPPGASRPRPQTGADAASRALKGLTVVEQAVAAPFATRQLADLGARVIKVERDTGDFARGYATRSMVLPVI
ncbi:CoA transferase [Arthrobacter sp. NPDC080073]|uniref:CoA transferase n=1 Tax=Arthrobacter sp. NPDC080073 TaxID=3155919 RepID=UPI003442A247